MRSLVSIFFVLFFFWGCSSKYEQKPSITDAKLEAVSWDELQDFDKDNLNLAFEVFQKGCQKSKKKPLLKSMCELSQTTTSPNKFFHKNFTPYQLIGDDGSTEGLITGYYEPILHGSLIKSEKYKYPIYKRPKDLLIIKLSNVYEELKDYRLRGKLVGNKVVPYYTREEIKEGKTPDLEPICYVDDKIGLFFLHIQGSGKIQLEDGTILNIGYADQNGRPYFSIGKELIEEGHLDKEEVSLQSIKKWLNENPEKIDEILNLNESYIFFQKREKNATGSLGVELVPFRNLAVDTNYIPLGFPVFIDTTNPIDNTPIRQLMVAADTGGAIKGEIRADFFFGSGEKAKQLAGNMKQKGNLYILIPNNIKDEKDAPQ